MQKLFTLVCAALLSVGLWAQHETIFSFSFDSTITQNVQTATGGTVYVGKPGSVAASSTVSCGYAMKLDGDPGATNTKYLQVLLQENAELKEGDTVVVSGYGGNSPSEGQSFVVSADRAAETRFATLQITAKNTEQNLYFVVKDAATGLGATSFYISRNTVSLYVSGAAVYRPAAATDPVKTVTILGETECYLGKTITLTATPDIKADTIWWTDKYGQKQESKDGVFIFTPEAVGEFEFTAWAENSHNTDPATKAQTITVKPALCAELYPAATGADLSVGSIVELTEASVGGSIKVAGMKTDKNSIKYNAAGLQLGGGSADSILVILDNYLKEGSVIELTMQSGGKDGTRGLNILANNAKVFEATWTVADASDVQTIAYTVKAEDALVGLNQFGLQRNNSVYLKSVLVSNCGDEVPEIPTALDNTDAAIKATKVVRNGQLLIEKNGETYNVLGTRVR